MNLDGIIDLDQRLTLALNSLHTPVGDHFWLMLSDKWVWVPFYLVLLYIAIRRLGWKRALILLGSVLLCFLLCDQITSAVKRGVGRLRPCYTTTLLEEGLHTPERRGGFFGFFSGHASNTFMLFACLITGLRFDRTRRYTGLAAIGFTWAGLVAVSRIMVGKHYLGDILVGTAFGLLLGWAMGLLARWLMHYIPSRRSGLKEYLEESIIPQYGAFDKAHREDHAREVIQRALALAEHYPVDRDVVFAAAACHDLGLRAGREVHHLESGKIIRADKQLEQWFSPSEIETIAEAAEDHRASSETAPRSIYGRIIAEADRLIVPEKIIRRTIQYGLAHYPELPKEGHWERTLEHLHEKYAEGGYLRLWIPESPNAAQLERLRAIIRDESALRVLFEQIYQEEHGL